VSPKFLGNQYLSHGFSHTGGLGEAVIMALAGEKMTFKHLAVEEIPRSGPPAALMDKYGISAKCISKAVQQLLSA